MLKPMHEYYASYDIYQVIQRRRLCLSLKNKWLQCKRNESSCAKEKQSCKKNLDTWTTFCTGIMDPEQKISEK